MYIGGSTKESVKSLPKAQGHLGSKETLMRFECKIAACLPRHNPSYLQMAS